MKLAKWGVIGSVVFMACFAVQGAVNYQITQKDGSGRSFVVINPDNTTYRIQFELDGSKFIERLMALLTTTVSEEYMIRFEKVVATGRTGVKIYCQTCAFAGTSPRDRIIWMYRDVQDPCNASSTIPVPVQVQWEMDYVEGGGGKGTINLYNDASPADIMKFDYALSAVFHNLFNTNADREVEAIDNSCRDFQLIIRQ